MAEITFIAHLDGLDENGPIVDGIQFDAAAVNREHEFQAFARACGAEGLLFEDAVVTIRIERAPVASGDVKRAELSALPGRGEAGQ